MEAQVADSLLVLVPVSFEILHESRCTGSHSPYRQLEMLQEKPAQGPAEQVLLHRSHFALPHVQRGPGVPATRRHAGLA